MPYGNPGQYLDAQMAGRNSMRSQFALPQPPGRRKRPWEYGPKAEAPPAPTGPSEDAQLAGASLEGIGLVTEAILAPMGIPGLGAAIAGIGALTPAADAAVKNPNDTGAKARSIAGAGRVAGGVGKHAWSPMYHPEEKSAYDWSAELPGLVQPLPGLEQGPSATDAARMYGGSPFRLRRRDEVSAAEDRERLRRRRP